MNIAFTLFVHSTASRFQDSLTALHLEAVREDDQPLQPLSADGVDTQYRAIRGAGSGLGAGALSNASAGPAGFMSGVGRPVLTARPIATLENFRALVRRELKYFGILLVIAIAFLAPFTVTNQSDISKTGTTSFLGWVLVIYQIMQRIFTFSIYSIFSRHFILVCGCHTLDVEQHLLRYKLALKSSFFSDEALRQIFADAAELGGSSDGDSAGSGSLVNRSSNAALGLSLRLALEGFFHELTSEFLRMNKLVRATSKAFRAFVGIAITLSFVEALISVWIYITSSTDPKSPHTWDQFWLLVPCTLYFYMSSACLYSAAKINHMGMNISRLGVELQCGLRTIFANIRVSPAAAGASAGELDNDDRILPLDISAALSTHDMIYLQNTCAALCTLVNFRPIGVSLWGVTMNRQFFLSLISPLAAFALFLSQRYLTLYSPGGSP